MKQAKEISSSEAYHTNALVPKKDQAPAPLILQSMLHMSATSGPQLGLNAEASAEALPGLELASWFNMQHKTVPLMHDARGSYAGQLLKHRSTDHGQGRLSRTFFTG